MALTTLERIKALLNIPASNTRQDAWLDALRLSVEASVQEYLGRKLERATYTEYYNGNGLRTLWLRQRPVISVSSVHIDHDGYYDQGPETRYGSDTLLLPGVDYVLEMDAGGVVSNCGLLHRLNAAWPVTMREFRPGRVFPQAGPAFGNVKVVYVAGYDPIPDDIQLAVAWLVSYLRRSILQGGPLKEEQIGDYRYELFPASSLLRKYPELATADQLLARYKEFATGW